MLCCSYKIIDDARILFINGVSSEIPLFKIWEGEHFIRTVGVIRNQLMTEITQTTYYLHATLAFTIRFVHVGGDNKSLEADLWLLANQRCACCITPVEDWDTAQCFTPIISIGHRSRLYIDALDSLMHYIETGVVRNVGDTRKVGTILWAWDILKRHAGCNALPTETHGNRAAHLMMLHHLGTRMCIDSSQWTDDDRTFVTQRYSALMMLDADLHTDQTRWYPLVCDFDIDVIFPKVPTLHSFMRWFKSILIDYVLNTAIGGKPRKLLSKILLHVISKKDTQSWYSHLYAWHIREIVLTADAWSAVPQYADAVRVMMSDIIHVTRLSQHSTMRMIRVAFACTMLDPYIRSTSGRLHPASGISAGHDDKDLTFKDTLWKHQVTCHLCSEMLLYPGRVECRVSEEALEHMVGLIQRLHRGRGSSRNSDITRLDPKLDGDEEYRARYRERPQRPAQDRLITDPGDRGWIIMRTLSADLRPSIAYIVSVAEGLDLVQYRGDAVFITNQVITDLPWAELMLSHDILCACVESELCPAHADETSIPTIVQNEFKWFL
jgi:hypothetical protein